jgi:hypothetical protein
MKKESMRKSIRFQKLGLLPILDILGLSLDRFIFRKNVIAQEVFLPSEGACQDPVHNTWQLLTMRHMVLSKLDLYSGVHSFERPSDAGDAQGIVSELDKSTHVDDDQGAESGHTQKRPIMLLIKRSKHSTSTRQRKDGFRQWSDGFTSNIVVLLKETFPQYQVKLFSDMDKELMDSVPKQIALFHRAAVVIGGMYVKTKY